MRSVPRLLILGLVLAGPALAAGSPSTSGSSTNAPTPKLIQGGKSVATVPAPAPVAWRDIEAALAEARRANRPLLVDVYTDWCGWCKRMEKTTYADAAVRDYLSRSFVAVKLDAEDDDTHVPYGGRDLSYREFADQFKVSSYPTTLFLAQDGKLITVVPGYVKPEKFLTLLKYIGDGHYRTRSWEEYSGAAAGAP